jgi:hypothetical protein
MKKIGSIFTDVAAIVVADPCKIMSPEKYKEFMKLVAERNRTFTLEEFKMLAEAKTKKAKEAIKKKIVKALPHPGGIYKMEDCIIFTTLGPADGWLNVSTKKDAKGNHTKIIIDLNPKTIA